MKFTARLTALIAACVVCAMPATGLAKSGATSSDESSAKLSLEREAGTRMEQRVRVVRKCAPRVRSCR